MRVFSSGSIRDSSSCSATLALSPFSVCFFNQRQKYTVMGTSAFTHCTDLVVAELGYRVFLLLYDLGHDHSAHFLL